MSRGPLIKPARWPAVAALALRFAAPLSQQAEEILAPTGQVDPDFYATQIGGRAPTEIISAPDIQRTGQQDVLQVLKRMSTSFQGSMNAGQTLNQGGTGESYLGLHNLPSLVLVDGHRLAPSAASQGGRVDLNSIPLSMIERIEILKDGGSSVYGADAAGGVVNIVTKRKFDGVEVSGRFGLAMDQSWATEERGSIMAGAHDAKTYVIAGGDWYHMDPLKASDRPPANYTNGELYDRGVSDAGGTGRTPGRIGGFILAGDSQYLAPSGSGYTDPSFIPGLITPPVFPGLTFNSIAAYEAHAVVAGFPDPLNPGRTLHLAPYANLNINQSPAVTNSPNGALLYLPPYTYAIQEQNRGTAFANVSRDLVGKALQVYGLVFYAHTDSIGQLAPASIGNLFTDGRIGIPANNPFNPFGIPLGVGGYADPSSPNFIPGYQEPNLQTSFTDVGPRRVEHEGDNYHLTGGLRGDLSDTYSYDVSYGYNRDDERTTTRNAIDGRALNAALTPNPVLNDGRTSSLLDPNTGLYVPIYNPFALGGVGANSPLTLNAIRTTLSDTGLTELHSIDGKFSGAPWLLPAGWAQFSVGAQFIRESLSLNYNELTREGLSPGQNQANPTPEISRQHWAAFAEVQVPICSDWAYVPGFHSLDLTASGRYESFDPGGSAAEPKIGLKWQPVNSKVTFRGTFSGGFLAPSLYELQGAPYAQTPIVVLPDTIDPTQLRATQERVFYTSNPTLAGADTRTVTAGVVLAPKNGSGFTLTADYYHTTATDLPYSPNYNTVLAGLNQASAAALAHNDPTLLSGYRWYSSYAQPNGLRLSPGDQITHGNYGTLTLPTLTGAAERLDGIDATLRYIFNTDHDGSFDIFVNGNFLIDYDYRPGPSYPFGVTEALQYYNFRGQYTDPNYLPYGQGNLPEWTISPGLTWMFRSFSYTITARYLPGLEDPGNNHPIGQLATASQSNLATIDPVTGTTPGASFSIPDYYSVDMQVAFLFRSSTRHKWYDNMKLTLGCNNVTDRLAPLISGSSEDHTDKATYDLLGRFLYIEIGKKF